VVVGKRYKRACSLYLQELMIVVVAGVGGCECVSECVSDASETELRIVEAYCCSLRRCWVALYSAILTALAMCLFLGSKLNALSNAVTDSIWRSSACRLSPNRNQPLTNSGAIVVHRSASAKALAYSPRRMKHAARLLKASKQDQTQTHA
jgi:hypothetical protein